MIPVAIIMSVLVIALALNSFRLCGKVEGAEAKSKALQSDLRDMDVVRASMKGRLLDKGLKAREIEDALAEAKKRAACLKSEIETLHTGADKMEEKLDAEMKRADLAERNRRKAHDSTSKVAAKLKTVEDECLMWRWQYQATRDACDAFAETSERATLKAALDRAPSPEAEPTVCCIYRCNGEPVNDNEFCVRHQHIAADEAGRKAREDTPA